MRSRRKGGRMSVTITYDGPVDDLTIGYEATLELHEAGTQRHVHGFNWDGNISRLAFDPGTATNMVLSIRPGPKVPRLGRRSTKVTDTNFPAREVPAAPPPAEEAALFSDGGAYSVDALYSDGSPA